MSRKVISYILGALFLYPVCCWYRLSRIIQLIMPPLQAGCHDPAGQNKLKNQEVLHHEEEGFSPSDFIFDHILDAYEWHILSYNDFHLSIPLPVIIYSVRPKDLNVFMFSKFHHGHADYNGFRYESHGENKGKIVEIMDDGSTVIPRLDLSFTKNVLAIMISLHYCLLWYSFLWPRLYSARPDKAPTGMQNLMEPIILIYPG